MIATSSERLELMRKLYWDDGLNTREIAERLGTCASNIRGLMRRWDIPRRSQSDSEKGINAKPINMQLVIQLYCHDFLSVHEIGKRLGVSGAMIHSKLRALGLNRTVKQTIAINGSNNPFPYGEQNPMWNGGKIMQRRYTYPRLCPNHPYANGRGYVMEHRLVMEQSLGRVLLPAEVVHHKNRDTGDNRIENLMLFSNNAEHIRYERDDK